jgi:hypothetical protein
MSKTCKHFNHTDLSNAVIQVVNRKGYVILTKICIVTTNVNLGAWGGVVVKALRY